MKQSGDSLFFSKHIAKWIGRKSGDELYMMSCRREVARYIRDGTTAEWSVVRLARIVRQCHEVHDCITNHQKAFGRRHVVHWSS
jgi:hypothetical protein